jgi:hypothetical protein
MFHNGTVMSIKHCNNAMILFTILNTYLIHTTTGCTPHISNDFNKLQQGLITFIMLTLKSNYAVLSDIKYKHTIVSKSMGL